MSQFAGVYKVRGKRTALSKVYSQMLGQHALRPVAQGEGTLTYQINDHSEYATLIGTCFIAGLNEPTKL